MLSDIVKEIKPEKVILFGSHAKGEQNENSDIDLCIVAETNKPVPLRVMEVRRILSGYKVPKDIIVKTPSEFGRYSNIVNSIDYEIDRYGKVLYERR
jgi:predicted nucleotidyltransferase